MRTAATAVIALSLAGCMQSGIKTQSQSIERDQMNASQRLMEPYTKRSRVEVVRSNYLPVKRVATGEADSAWLRKIRYKGARVLEPTPLSSMVRSMAEQGINITSTLPLDQYMYTGFSINATTADAALRMMLAPLDLDFEADPVTRTVIIKSLPSRTWYLNLGNRTTAFNTSDSGSSSSSISDDDFDTESSSSDSSTDSDSDDGSSSEFSGDNGVQSQDDFWASLRKEMRARLTVVMPSDQKTAMAAGSEAYPAPGLPPLAQAVQAQGMGENGRYTKKQIGHFAINPETGAVTVQAPHWILASLDQYFERVKDMYNTDISFEGQIVMVSSDDAHSEGIDLQAFATVADKWGFSLANNALGGLTVSLPTSGNGLPNIAAPGAIADTVFGVTGLNDSLQLFNAYLQSVGKVSVVQRPMLTTTSGVPGEFSRVTTRRYQTSSQTTAASEGGSTVGTQNSLVPIEFGTNLRINPRYDVETGLIRAQIALDQTLETGTQNFKQALNTTTGGVYVQETEVPIETQYRQVSEVLLRDGDLIVLGGHQETTDRLNESGIPGKSGPMGGIFGVKSNNQTTTTYYFALQVKVNRH
ncbi:type II and III secretion system protein [Marinobacterium stanieri]|uniref:Type II and III secretion system protein n=2 Tax=Marinobacterium stanieri TaxID=49186 RepID=A0A1N6XHC0_9GAMM|nr:type II and III secretion system protein [Marinobacterium stanieri]